MSHKNPKPSNHKGVSLARRVAHQKALRRAIASSTLGTAHGSAYNADLFAALVALCTDETAALQEPLCLRQQGALSRLAPTPTAAAPTPVDAPDAAAAQLDVTQAAHCELWRNWVVDEHARLQARFQQHQHQQQRQQRRCVLPELAALLKQQARQTQSMHRERDAALERLARAQAQQLQSLDTTALEGWAASVDMLVEHERAQTALKQSYAERAASLQREHARRRVSLAAAAAVRERARQALARDSAARREKLKSLMGMTKSQLIREMSIYKPHNASRREWLLIRALRHYDFLDGDDLGCIPQLLKNTSHLDVQRRVLAVQEDMERRATMALL